MTSARADEPGCETTVEALALFTWSPNGGLARSPSSVVIVVGSSSEQTIAVSYKDE